jgi:hypothetical protein
MSSLVRVELSGHLTEDALRAALADSLRSAASASVALLFDCSAMTGYELSARNAFVEWHRAHRDRVRGVAIVTTRTLWHMVIAAMAFASGQVMKPFETVDQAERWLRTLGH